MLRSARSPKLRKALAEAKKNELLYLVLDGTLIPIDRVRADRPFYFGKHRMHGMNLQVIAGPDGGIVGELAATGMIVLADKAYQGAGEHITTPYRGRNKAESQKQANRSHARLRGPGERANAQVKTWKILRKLRCCPHRAGHLAKAIHVLHTREPAAR